MKIKIIINYINYFHLKVMEYLNKNLIKINQLFTNLIIFNLLLLMEIIIYQV